MVCADHLINALTRTHQALIACSECIEETDTEQERKDFQDLTITLAKQAKTLQDKLLSEKLRGFCNTNTALR